MFSIEFYPSFDDEPTEEARGVIVLDDFMEDVFACLCVWDRSDYERQWLEAVERVLDGEVSALMTAYHEPEMTNFMRCWPMYPIDANVRLQERWLFLDQLGEPFDLDKLGQYVQPYANMSEDGEPFSEWAASREDLAAFLGRR